MEVTKGNGSLSIVSLLRPNWWLKANEGTAIGNQIALSITEMGINGIGTITKIYPTQIDTRLWDEKRNGDYVLRPITGKFVHQSKAVWDFYFAGMEKPIGATENHPFWSVDRQVWIAVGDLQIGEQVKTTDTTLAFRNKVYLGDSYTVYNLEVYREHNYLVGEDGVLVHNSSKNPIGILSSNTIEGVRLLSGQIYKNGKELNVNIPLIYKQDGYSGKVFDNLLNHLDQVAKKQGTTSLKITFETVSDKGTVLMYKKMADKYGFNISGKNSPIGGGAIDIIWFK